MLKPAGASSGTVKFTCDKVPAVVSIVGASFVGSTIKFNVVVAVSLNADVGSLFNVVVPSFKVPSVW